MTLSKVAKVFLSLSFLSISNIKAEEITKKAKNNQIELGYVFNKASIKNLPQRYDFSIKNDNRNINLNFPWGEQGFITYFRKFDNSIYSFMASFTGVHNSKNAYRTLEDDQYANVKVSDLTNGAQLSIDYVGKTGSNTFFSLRNQFNFFNLDLFVKADLEETKHAQFSVFGGAIIGGYNYKNSQKGVSNLDGFLHEISFKASNTDYFFGPNAKILVNAPFFNKHLQLSLRLGAGFMMGYYSQSYYLNKAFVPPVKLSYGGENQFRFSYQFDVLAQAAIYIRNFYIASGITQFYYQTPQNNNLITFGGPFVKAGIDF
jgi:hypothetical protein